MSYQVTLLATFLSSTTSVFLLQSIDPSDKNNGQLCAERKTPGERQSEHTWRGTLSIKERQNKQMEVTVINRRAQMIKERKQLACVCDVCVHMSARDLLSEQLAADAAP